MVTKTYCDRCLKEIKVPITIDIKNLQAMDLCEECYAQFKEFIKKIVPYAELKDEANH